MKLTNLPNFYRRQQSRAQQAMPVDPLFFRLNRQADGDSPLKAARQALLDARSRLDEHRNGQTEQGLGGYAAYEYREPLAGTQENAASETSGMICRTETGVRQWRKRVFS